MVAGFDWKRDLISENYYILQGFVHVSTAYSNCNRNGIEERIYPTALTPQAVTELLADMKDEEAMEITPK